ncbi:MAG TPA: thioredoxin domain-containing protein [Pyrinomonadaceae bacterium]|nr:thioredoxin domain-containing protein [Pyrinomonadaceae bacterium]
MKRALPFLLIAAVLAIALVIAWSLMRSGTDAPIPSATPVVSQSVSPNNPAPPTPAAIAEPGADPPHAEGPANALVTIEEFGDFQCPPCAMLHPVLKEMEKEFGSKLRVIFREFPLVPAHEHALSAARSAEAAALQGKFWEMHDLIYTNQNAWKNAFDVRPIFEEYAKTIGLNLERYRQDLTSETVQNRIFLDGKRARALGVKGTPTVFLNGREVPFPSLEPTKLRPLIEAEIASRSK